MTRTPYDEPRSYRDSAGRLRQESIEGSRIRARMQEAYLEGYKAMTQRHDALKEALLTLMGQAEAFDAFRDNVGQVIFEKCRTALAAVEETK